MNNKDVGKENAAKNRQIADALAEIQKCKGWSVFKELMASRERIIHAQSSVPYWRFQKMNSVEKYISAQSYMCGQRDELQFIVNMVEGILIPEESAEKGE